MGKTSRSSILSTFNPAVADDRSTFLEILALNPQGINKLSSEARADVTPSALQVIATELIETRTRLEHALAEIERLKARLGDEERPAPLSSA
jgi:hypothetical protein